ncbi:MAG: PUA domain-containing protein [Thermofilaceae archaeon]|nr:PUA domain-containing protein [Thermofilaceae archaeon]
MICRKTGKSTKESLSLISSSQLSLASDDEVKALKILLAYQFGKGADATLNGEVKIRRSSSTGRVREVYLGDSLIGTVRATDGFFVPTLRGAELLVKNVPFPNFRVVVQEEVKDFVAKGRSVFCKHVVYADPEIRPGEEVFIVDKEGGLVAMGRAVVSGSTMNSKKTGVAVKVRKGIKNK